MAILTQLFTTQRQRLRLNINLFSGNHKIANTLGNGKHEISWDGNHKINSAFILNIKMHLRVQFSSLSSNTLPHTSYFTCLKRQPELNVKKKQKGLKLKKQKKIGGVKKPTYV